MKRKILLICLLALILSMVSAGTYAFYSVTETASNVITAGGLTFDVVETGANGSAYPVKPMTIMPGDVVDKVVRVRNTGSHPMFLRVKLTPGINDPALTVTNCMALEINYADWTVNGGYYYYNTILQPGQITAPLLTKVTFVGDQMDNAYLGKLFSLDVAVDALQSQHNGTSPLTAQGWPDA